MKQQTYLNTLKQSLAGLPAAQVDDILGDYQQHFIDGMQRGRTEEEIAQALGDPRKIAAEFRAMTRVEAFQHQRSVGNFGRMALALVGLAGFNLFVLPFLLVAPLLLFSLYLLSASSLFGGTVISASGMLNVDSISLDHSDQRKSIDVVNFFTGHDRDSWRARNMHVGFEVPPYAIVYREAGPVTAAADAVPKQALSRGSRGLVGILYIGLGIGVYLLTRKLGRLMWAWTLRFIDAQARILRDARNVHA